MSEVARVQLNELAMGTTPKDMAQTDEFKSLLQSASDLGLAHDPKVRYVARNVVARQVRFNVLEWGPPDAPTILCLLGGHQSAHSWDLVSLNLAQRYRVITPDQRGHGDSEWVRSGAYSNDEMAADIIALSATLGLHRPIVMGHSMGGRNTLLAAQSEPELARALVIVDIGPEISEHGGRAIASFVAANEEFEDLNAFVENVRRYDPYRSLEHIERTVRYNLFVRADGKYVSKCDRLPRKLGLTESLRSTALSLASVATIRQPVLVVRGGESRVLEADAADRFVAALHQGQLLTVADCSHNVHSQNTHGFLQAIDSFLATHSSD